jgi:hypothetical protein
MSLIVSKSTGFISVAEPFHRDQFVVSSFRNYIENSESMGIFSDYINSNNIILKNHYQSSV